MTIDKDYIYELDRVIQEIEFYTQERNHFGILTMNDLNDWLDVLSRINGELKNDP